jgi:WD40 repeat protein
VFLPVPTDSKGKVVTAPFHADSKYSRSPRVLSFSGGVDCGVSISSLPAVGSKSRQSVDIFEKLHSTFVTAVSSGQDGRSIVTGAADGTVRLFGISRPIEKLSSLHSFRSNSALIPNQVAQKHLLELRATFAAHSCAISCLDLCTCQNMLATGGIDGLCFTWDATNGQFLRSLSGHDGPLCSVSVNEDTGDIVTATETQLQIFSINGDLRATIKLGSIEFLRSTGGVSMAISTGGSDWSLPEGVVAVVGHISGAVSLWKLALHRTKTDDVKSCMENQNNSKKTPESDGSTMDVKGLVASEEANFLLCPRRGQINTSPESPSIPREELFLSSLLATENNHSSKITAIRISSNRQELFVGDASGVLTHWRTAKLNEMESDDAVKLLQSPPL